MRRIDPTVTAAADKQAETETKGNQALGLFKGYAKLDIENETGTQTNYRIQSDFVLANDKRIPDLPNPDEWCALADALDDANVFDEVADLMDKKDAWWIAREFQPGHTKNGKPILGVAFWLFVHGWTNEDGTKARSRKIGDSQPITPAQAARFYVDSQPYFNGDPLPVLLATQKANARKALALRNRQASDAQGSTPDKTDPALNNPQTTPEPIDDEQVLQAAQQIVDDAILAASEAKTPAQKRKADKALRTAYTNARAEINEGNRQGLVRNTTAAAFVEKIGSTLAAAHAELATA